jgi:hypothetical protein
MQMLKVIMSRILQGTLLNDPFNYLVSDNGSKTLLKHACALKTRHVYRYIIARIQPLLPA